MPTTNGAQKDTTLPDAPIRESATATPIDPSLEQLDPQLDSRPDTPPEPETRLQILDLHTQQPIISYENQIYSCTWTSTVGTDLLLSAPDPSFTHPVLVEKPNVSVLATTSIKLVARPVQLVPRTGENTDEATSTPTEPESSTAAVTPTPAKEKDMPVKIPVGPAPSRARQDQANFLERLMAIKAAKGEKDSVTVYAQKVNQGTGWRSQQKAQVVQQAREATEEGPPDSDGECLGDDIGPRAPRTMQRGRGSRIGRPRGSKRKAGARNTKGGLFRDYRPQLWDTERTDNRYGSLSTPERWDELEEMGGVGSPGASSTGNASSTPTFPNQQRPNSGISSSGAFTAASASPPSLDQETLLTREENVLPANGSPSGANSQGQAQTNDQIGDQSASGNDQGGTGVPHSDAELASDIEMLDVR